MTIPLLDPSISLIITSVLMREISEQSGNSIDGVVVECAHRKPPILGFGDLRARGKGDLVAGNTCVF